MNKLILFALAIVLLAYCGKGGEELERSGTVALRGDTSNVISDFEMPSSTQRAQPQAYLYLDWVFNAKSHKVYAKSLYGWTYVTTFQNDDDYSIPLNNLPVVNCGSNTYWYLRIEESYYPYADCNEGRSEYYHPYGLPGAYCTPNKVDTDWPTITYNGYLYIRLNTDPGCVPTESAMKIYLSNSSNVSQCVSYFYDYDDCLY